MHITYMLEVGHIKLQEIEQPLAGCLQAFQYNGLIIEAYIRFF